MPANTTDLIRKVADGLSCQVPRRVWQHEQPTKSAISPNTAALTIKVTTSGRPATRVQVCRYARRPHLSLAGLPT